MKHVTAIVLAAGRGLRFSRIDSLTEKGGTKPLIEINSKPLIIYSLNILSQHADIKEIILVANSENLKGIANKIRQYRIKKIEGIILGGRRRQDSVVEALKIINPRTDLVLIHDGVRPFINKQIVSKVLKEAEKYGAAVVGVPVEATIKEVHSPQSTVHRNFRVKKTLNRTKLWEIQTPQVFRKTLILKAYEKFGNTEVTDDASLVEKLGAKVRIVTGSSFNIKITTPEDLVLAEAIVNICHTK